MKRFKNAPILLFVLVTAVLTVPYARMVIAAVTNADADPNDPGTGTVLSRPQIGYDVISGNYSPCLPAA